MALTVVDAAEEAFLDLILAVNYTVRLFTNDATISESLAASGLTEATFSGYSAAALTGGSWVTTPGDPCSGAYAQQSFTSDSDQTPESIYGYYVVRTSDGALTWLEKFGSPVTIQFNLDRIDITPTITLADTSD